MGLITDPGAGLVDFSDYVFLAGATGLHERFGRIYTLVNGNIDSDNIKDDSLKPIKLKLGDDYGWTGNHTFEAGKLKLKGAGAGIVSFKYENTGNDREHTFRAKSSNDIVAMLSDLNNGMVSNARLVLSAGVLKLVGDDGNDPSSSNPVIVSIPSSTAGKWDQITIISPLHCTINDATSADSYFNGGGGVTFATTTGRAWAEEMPFMIYVATDGVTPVLFLSRDPRATVTPVAANIGYKDNPPASANQNNFFAWSATNVTVTHASKSCIKIGTVIMTKSAANDWTISTLSSSIGINNFNPFQGRQYTMPTGQNGADSGKFFTVTGGGTAPTYNLTNLLNYTIDLNGYVSILAHFSASGGAGLGAGSGTLRLFTPYINNSGVSILGTASHLNSGVSDYNCIMVVLPSQSWAFFNYQAVLNQTLSLSGDDQTSVVTRGIVGTIQYKAF